MSLNLLLVFIPIALALDWTGGNPILVFVVSALAIVPLAGLMGRATEHLSKYVGETVAGLMNASLGVKTRAGWPRAGNCSGATRPFQDPFPQTALDSLDAQRESA